MAQTTPHQDPFDSAARPRFDFRLPEPPPSSTFDLSFPEFANRHGEQMQASTMPGAPPVHAPLAAEPGRVAVGTPARPTVTPLAPRSTPRRPSALGASLRNLVGVFDWGRTFSLHRRLLTGDLRVLREVTDTETDSAPTLAVMGMAALAAALGAWLWLVFTGEGVSAGHAAGRVIGLGLVCSVAAWAASVAATWWAMQRLFDLRVELRRLSRPLALAAGFGVWQLLLFVPGVSFAIGILALIAWLFLSVVAARAAAPSLDDRSAVISVGIGFGVYVVLLTLTANLFGIAPGAFVHAAY